MSQPGVKGDLGSESLHFLESTSLLGWETSGKNATSLRLGFHICKMGLIGAISQDSGHVCNMWLKGPAWCPSAEQLLTRQ